MWAQPDSWCHLPVGFMLVIHILYDVYFICSSSLSMDSVRYIANHDVLCFLPSETAFWRLAQNEHSSLVFRTQRETVNGQSSRWKECWTPQEEPKKSSISTEEPEEPHRLSALLQPKRPINNSLSSLEVFTAARAGSQQLHYYSSCHRVLSRGELRPLALFSKLISEPYCGSAIHCESRRAERGAGESLFLYCCFWCGTWSEAISQCVQRANAGKSRNLAWNVEMCTASDSDVWESFVCFDV